MKNTNALIIIGIVVLAGGLIFFTSSSDPKVEENNTEPIAAAVEVNADISEDKTEDQSEGSVLGIEDRYVDFSQEHLDNASEDDKLVLFFAALGWCPTCQAADRNFKEDFDQIPEDVTILKVDFDNDSENKQKYNIVMQDTFVQIDREGNEITRWNSGGKGVDSLIDNII